MLNYDLLTKYGEKFDVDNVLKDYPRPQFKRDSYLNLNGLWKYKISKNQMEDEMDDFIVVPYPIESTLSKVKKTLKKNENIFYKKEFVINNSFLKDITILHIDACDQVCEIFLNGSYVGKHIGGYLPIILDISDKIKSGMNTLVVKVRDNMSYNYPTGKQSDKRGNIWYTPISGIWGSVWLESVSDDYIADVNITPNIDLEVVTFEFQTRSNVIEVKIFDGDKVLFDQFTDQNVLVVDIENPHLWTPEDPHLYYVEFKTKNDTVKSYFAMRKFSCDSKHFLLNNKPYYINGLLDQGYFSDGIYTAPDYQIYKDDILAMKELGFNTLRKHIKIEPLIFYHYCDKLGMLVLQDMVNVGKYSFFKDTILPFAGIRRKRLIIGSASKTQTDNFIKHSKATLKYLYNVPCIGYYTIFNEGWGQSDGDLLYDIISRQDQTRVVDATSGWFRQKKSDVVSEHIYFKQIKLKKEKRPIIVSEFGGYTLKIANHSFNDTKTFGYKKFDSIEEFQKGFIKLYEDDILNNLKNGLAGSIYTQVSDVEDETNGILTYDRKVNKLDKEVIRPLMDKIIEESKKY